MDCSKTTDFFAEAKRLCDSRTACSANEKNKERCPLLVFCKCNITTRSVEETIMAIENLQKWSNERSKKTYAQDFFEKFPDAPKDEAVKGKCPWACRIGIYGGGCPKIDPEIDCCYECWNEPMEE